VRALPLLEPLAASSRLSGASASIRALSWAEPTVLVLLGFAAAYLTLNLDLDFRLPGHAILRSVFPFALGLALVPRRGAGTVMGSAALVGVLFGGMAHGAPGWGASTSLLLTGPALDLAVRRANPGRGVYLAIVAAGVAVNLAAFALRLGARIVAPGGGRTMASWLPEAAITYPACGALAGALAAAVWFRAAVPRDAEAGA
jgi:hypothetical protein